MSTISLSKQTFETQIKSGVTLVDFWAAWCGPCKIQLPILDELSEEIKVEATIAKVNVDNEPELADQFGIRSIPTLLLFKDGQVVDTMIGVNQKEILKEKISRFI